MSREKIEAHPMTAFRMPMCHEEEVRDLEKDYAELEEKVKVEIEDLQLTFNVEIEKKDRFFRHSEKLEERIKEFEQQIIDLTGKYDKAYSIVCEELDQERNKG